MPGAPGRPEIYLWRTPLDLADGPASELTRLLSPDEQGRAERFHFERDRRRFVVGRGFLRTLLGFYVGEEPIRLRFRYGMRGKPLAIEGAPGLRFNLSHSHGLALCGVTWGREIGVDLEQLRFVADAEAIALHFFSTSEAATLRQLPENQKIEGFFNCWTRKEAYLKAVGDGLTRPLSDIDVSLVPGEPAQIIRTQGDPQEAARWRLHAFQPFPGCVGAVCVEAGECRFAFWEGLEEAPGAGA